MRASARIHGNGLHRKTFFGDPSRSPTPIPVSRPSVLFSRVMEVRTGRAGRRRSKGKAAPRAAFPWGVKGTSLLGVPPVENPKFPCEHWKCGPLLLLLLLRRRRRRRRRHLHLIIWLGIT